MFCGAHFAAARPYSADLGSSIFSLPFRLCPLVRLWAAWVLRSLGCKMCFCHTKTSCKPCLGLGATSLFCAIIALRRPGRAVGLSLGTTGRRGVGKPAAPGRSGATACHGTGKPPCATGRTTPSARRGNAVAPGYCAACRRCSRRTVTAKNFFPLRVVKPWPLRRSAICR